MVVKHGKPIGYRISNGCNNSFSETSRCRGTSASLYLSWMSPVFLSSNSFKMR
jgi:hypothetical protein